MEGELPLKEGPADELVQGVVPAHVLPQGDEPPLPVKEGGGVEAPGGAEEALGLPQALGQGEEEVGVHRQGRGRGEAEPSRVGEGLPAAGSAGGGEGEVAPGRGREGVAQEDLDDPFPRLGGEASVCAGGDGEDLLGVLEEALGVEEARGELRVLPRGAEDHPQGGHLVPVAQPDLQGGLRGHLVPDFPPPAPLEAGHPDPGLPLHGRSGEGASASPRRRWARISL